MTIAGLWRYGNWRHVATGCTTLVELYAENESLRRSGTARINEGSHNFTCHPHVYPQVEWTIPAFTPQLQSITALWPVLISRPAAPLRVGGWVGLYCRRKVLFKLDQQTSVQYILPSRPKMQLTQRRPASKQVHACKLSKTQIYIAHRRKTSNALYAYQYTANRNVFRCVQNVRK